MAGKTDITAAVPLRPSKIMRGPDDGSRQSDGRREKYENDRRCRYLFIPDGFILHLLPIRSES